ncbi:CopD family protein [Burkholderia ubonensis]|uniref:CopD family protein n=1 Tax=Burkholderia ubonensis TaxID=101571 RepID=UPI0007571D46|nr:CopD family protein [Burkholderia ubonensis]KVS47177.1 copper resistance protein CopD [Burkholderia ubonensis]KVS55144.1 copper resistance protein CopD [Burkholderia ubonensis]KVS81126.1 copper resistance protein CopD [Burkholderia ubonensis]KVS86319.1 copper resistance protein CopD [Burkholderia ubonensis]KVS91976.1 copper resistance protein CopD [Burkholderia ubonensis]
MRIDSLWIGQVALAALMDAAFATAVGSALLKSWLAKEGARPVIAPSHPAWLRAQHSLMAAAAALLLADLGWLVYEAAAMSGAGLGGALGAIPTVLAQTHAGFAWSVAFGGTVVLAVVALSRPDGPLAYAVLWLAVIVIAAGKASLGHAADTGAFSAAIALQTLHLLVTAAWGGLVLAGGLAVLPALGSSVARGALIRIAQRLSRTSIVALAFVLATGALNAARGLGGSLAPLDGSAWGRVLLLKLLLVALALVLGGLNRFSALPRLRRTASTEDAHTFRNILHLEGLTMIGVFIAAAVLAASVPGFAALG